MTTVDRRTQLNREVEAWVRDGYRVETQGDTQAVMLKGHRPNHILHLILTLVTLGAWAIVWILVAIFGGERRRLIVVDDEGTTHVSRV
jgi:hypothetical protein